MKDLENFDIRADQFFELMRGSTSAERRFMKHILKIASRINTLIHSCGIDPDHICKTAKVKKNKWDDYLSGAYDYSVRDIAVLDHLEYLAWKERKETTYIEATYTEKDKKDSDGKD